MLQMLQMLRNPKPRLRICAGDSDDQLPIPCLRCGRSRKCRRKSRICCGNSNSNSNIVVIIIMFTIIVMPRMMRIIAAAEAALPKLKGGYNLIFQVMGV